MFVNIKVVIYI